MTYASALDSARSVGVWHIVLNLFGAMLQERSIQPFRAVFSRLMVATRPGSWSLVRQESIEPGRLRGRAISGGEWQGALSRVSHEGLSSLDTTIWSASSIAAAAGRWRDAVLTLQAALWKRAACCNRRGLVLFCFPSLSRRWVCGMTSKGSSPRKQSLCLAVEIMPRLNPTATEFFLRARKPAGGWLLQSILCSGRKRDSVAKSAC